MSTERYEFDKPKQELRGPIDQEDMFMFRLPTGSVERFVKDFQPLNVMGVVVEPTKVIEVGRTFNVLGRYYPDREAAPNYSVPYDVTGTFPGKIAHVLGKDALTMVAVQTFAQS